MSLIGKLSFCCKVLPAGHIFLRRLIDLSTTVKKLHHHLPLSADAKLDLQWWLDFLPQWSGKSLILQTSWLPNSAMQLYTDASRTQGWGAYWSGRWLQGHWSPRQCSMTVAWKELFAILVAVLGVSTGLSTKYSFTATIKRWSTFGKKVLQILWPWYECCIFVQPNITSIFVSCTFMVYSTK